jgi:hypothetical protein
LAIQYEFGVIDLDLEVEMERILLVKSVGDMGEERVVKSLLMSMMEYKVPGVCTAMIKASKLFNLERKALKDADRRDDLKKRLVEIQRERLVKGILFSSKCDQLIMYFDFDGNMKDYLRKLSFIEARIVFTYRARMFPTKENFPGRWTTSMLCVYCCNLESDQHLFNCCGYMDVISNSGITHESLIRLESCVETLSRYAKVLIKIYDRLMVGREDKELNS